MLGKRNETITPTTSSSTFASVLKQEDKAMEKKQQQQQPPEKLVQEIKINNEADKKQLEEDDPIDPTQPLLYQVANLGSKYEAWVYKPSKVKTYRLFKSDFMEEFSITNWYIIPLVWIPVAFAYGYASLNCFGQNANENTSQFPFDRLCRIFTAQTSPLSYSSFVFYYFLGGLIWTLSEYVLHRFLFHTIVKKTSRFWITFHFMLHGQHHKYPMDSGRLVFPPAAAIAFAFLFHVLFHSIFTPNIARAMVSGFATFYTSYDLIHYYIHHGYPTFEYFKRLKISHMKHHYADRTKGFGISSQLWDYPFQTK